MTGNRRERKSGTYSFSRSRAGLLPLYILHSLSDGPKSGYDLITSINQATEGSWKPGSGSIYPILRNLLKRGLVKVVGTGTRSKQIYSLTDKGEEFFKEAKEIFNSISLQKWHTIKGMMLTLVEPQALARMLNETIEMQQEAWSKVLDSDLPDEDKVFLLKQHKLLVERHSLWLDKKIREIEKKNF